MRQVVIAAVVAGAVVGFWLGVKWAETSRARHDIKRIWRGRRDYRGRRK